MIKIYSFSFEYSDAPPVIERQELRYVFDCRPIKNPGRIAEMQTQTGFDTDVIEYLENQADIGAFLGPIKAIVDIALAEYLEKQDRYQNISFYFGCTGGRHRSVYSAESIARHIREKFSEPVEIRHLRLDVLGGMP